MIKEYDKILWDTITILKEQNRVENALALFKGLVERTFLSLNVSTEFLDDSKLNLPSNNFVKDFRKLDKEIYNSLKVNDTTKAYEYLVEYVTKLTEVIPGSSSKEILAKILAHQIARSGSNLPSLNSTIPAIEQVDYANTYSTIEVADIVGVTDQTIRRWCEKGKYPEAKKTDTGNWRIPKKYFKITIEEARKRNAFEQKLI